NRNIRHVRITLPPPRSRSGARCEQLLYGSVIDIQKCGLCCYLLKPAVREESEHFDRIVIGRPPQGIVQATEDLPGACVPAPPQVAGQFVETFDSIRQRAMVQGAHAAAPAAAPPMLW